MKKLNNKGVTLVELIVSFAIVAVAIIYFFQTLYTVKTLYSQTSEETDKYVMKDYALRLAKQNFENCPSDPSIYLWVVDFNTNQTDWEYTTNSTVTNAINDPLSYCNSKGFNRGNYTEGVASDLYFYSDQRTNPGHKKICNVHTIICR